MVEGAGARDKINAQAMDYKYLRGDAFSNRMAKQYMIIWFFYFNQAFFSPNS
jgi:hypothetical protein